MYCKRFHPKSPFYEKVRMITKKTVVLEYKKVKMITKRIVVLESFITIDSFDCDHTLLDLKKFGKVLD